MDEPPDPGERPDIPRVERKEPKPRKDLMENVDSFPGKTLCWASEMEELRKKEVTK